MTTPDQNAERPDSPMPTITITPGDRWTAGIAINGQDISAAVTAADVRLRPGELPSVSLALSLQNLGTIEGEAQIWLSDATREALIALGWTPPPVASVEETG